MAPEGYELIEYEIHYVKTWVIKDKEGQILFPLVEIFKHLFCVPFNATKMRKNQLKHTTRLRMTTPRQSLMHVAPEKQPPTVIIFGDLWCIRNLIRTRFVLGQRSENKGRDIKIEEFANYWGFSAIGFGTLTRREPPWRTYPMADQIAIAADPNHEYWLKCIECERYYPHTERFYRKENITCEKCLGRGFGIYSTGAYQRIEEWVKKRGRD